MSIITHYQYPEFPINLHYRKEAVPHTVCIPCGRPARQSPRQGEHSMPYQKLYISRRAPGVVTADAVVHAAEGRVQQRAGRADHPPIDPSLSSCIMAAQDAYLLEGWGHTPQRCSSPES